MHDMEEHVIALSMRMVTDFIKIKSENIQLSQIYLKKFSLV